MAYYALTISISAPASELIEYLGSLGSLGMVEEDDRLVAYFTDTADIAAIENDLTGFLTQDRQPSSDGFSIRREIIPEQDWNAYWKTGFIPIDVGKCFTILPPWHEKKQGRINLVIDPAMAFGTGHHETTRSCLVLLEKYSSPASDTSFLDLGTGTGILAIAAAKLGYRQVTAVDTDILAVDAARMNCEQNGASGITIVEGSTEMLRGRFDLITANIISGVLVRLSRSLAALMKPGGLAILSGILAEQAGEVVEAMEAAGLSIVEQYSDGKWMSLVVLHERG